MNQYDVAIIGAGVTGSAIARELSRYKLKVLVVEKDEDVCSGTSKANSAIVHAGYDAMPGTLKAKLNVRGAKLIKQLSETLSFPYKQNGSMILCFREQDKPKLKDLYDRGVTNGVADLKIITGDEARELEPALSKDVVAALLVPTGGIVCPFNLTIALAENACDNGVDFQFLTEVQNIEKTEDGWKLCTDKGDITSACLVNASGVYADKFHNMVSSSKLEIIPRRGEYVLMDKEAGTLVSHTIFQLPNELGKGVLVTPTVHGNLLVGPDAVDVDSKENNETTMEGMDDIKNRALMSVPEIPYRLTITSFAGLRAHEAGDDFILGEVEDAAGFYDAAGIESPGLSSAPAIGEYIAEMIVGKLCAEKKAEGEFIDTRKGFVELAKLPMKERNELIKQKKEYGTIVCRCENISEGEILDAIHRTLGAKSLDGIKRRVRQGMGRCQAGFCTPRTMEILSQELGIPMEQVAKNRPGSELIVG